MHALLLGKPVKELLDLPLAPTDDCVPTQLLTRQLGVAFLEASLRMLDGLSAS